LAQRFLPPVVTLGTNQIGSPILSTDRHAHRPLEPVWGLFRATPDMGILIYYIDINFAILLYRLISCVISSTVFSSYVDITVDINIRITSDWLIIIIILTPLASRRVRGPSA